MERIRNRCRLFAALLFAFGSVLMTGCGREEDFSQKPAYLKSATYFGDEWVLNFWNSETDHLEEELAQIRKDGFNGIILVLPWREFQPETAPVVYNAYAWEKLDRVMTAAAGEGLWVSLRVGYTWDYWPDGGDVRERFRNVMGDTSVLAAWDDYVKTVYEKASAHANFFGGFLTWEDFWSFTSYATELADTEESVRLARFCGYADYISERYSLEELSGLYGERISGYDRLPLPKKDRPALRLLYEFFDRWLCDFLAHSQENFPELSMEVRMDADLVPDEDGESRWYSHSATYACQGAPYTALMYGVPIGHINQGERLEAEEALAMSREMLDQVLLSTEGKKLYIEQFLYMDNTPGFEHNAQVKEDEVADYIVAMAGILRDRVMGYGVWTYRDYANNLLYNPQFALGESGWEMNGGARVTEHNGSMQAELPDGGQIRNGVSGAGPVSIRFTVDAEAPVSVRVSFGGETKTVTVQNGETAELVFENGGDGLAFTAESLCYLDNVKVYTHVQQGQLYDLDGREGTCIGAIRTLNRKLR